MTKPIQWFSSSLQSDTLQSLQSTDFPIDEIQLTSIELGGI